MSRSVPEWVGKDADTAIPDRVKLRVAARASDCCQACGMRVRHSGQVDHVIAIVNWNGAEDDPDDHGNRESNLQFLCQACHKAKTGDDVAEKSMVYRKRKKLGPLKRGQSEWSKRYHAMKEWKRKNPLP